MLKTVARKRSPDAQHSLADSINLEHGAGFLLRVASARANALFEDLTGQSEITPQQYGTLLILHQRGTLTPSELADAIHTDRSTTGEIVRRMVDPRVSPALRVDPVRLRQILNNFVSNAIKFTTEGWIDINVQWLGRAQGQVRG